MRTDEDLALGIQRGDMAALALLIERHYGQLLGFLYRMGLAGLAEDMVQETFLKVLNGIMLYQPSRPFKPWLYSIATNLARNHYISADARRTISQQDSILEALPGDDVPEAALIEAETTCEVLGALGQLPGHQREVVVLFYYQELSQKEIAAILQVPVGTVKSRLSLGLRRLREIIREGN